MEGSIRRESILASSFVGIVTLLILYLFFPGEIECPLSLKLSSVDRVGHRYHVHLEIENPTNHSVDVYREDEGFPDVFLTRTDTLDPLFSQYLGSWRLSNSFDLSSIPPRSKESITITFHIDEGDEQIVPELRWDPKYNLRERLIRGLGSRLPHKFTATRLGTWFRNRCFQVGASKLLQGEAFVPSQVIASHSESYLREEALQFVGKTPPGDFQNIHTRLSYMAIKSYSESNFESLDRRTRSEIERDAFDLYWNPQATATRESFDYFQKLLHLAELICQEVEFMHPDLLNDRVKVNSDSNQTLD